MAEENQGIVEPSTDQIVLKGNLISTFDAMASRISTLQVFTIKYSSDELSIARIESRDIQKRPFLFMVFLFSKNSITINYTIPLDSSPKLRRLYVIKVLLNILSLVADLYSVDNAELFQYTDSSIDEVLNSLSQSYSALFNNYDSLFNEYRELKRLNLELTASNKNLTVQVQQLSAENKSLSERLKVLEAYSDDSLMVMVEDWIEAHDSTIDINEFAQNFKVTPTRVEQILNKMVSLGYITLKG
ncbi:MAG: cell division protein ZapB [Candidatus Micrarchaeia archaeon]